jgi:hypothetical protein
VSTEQGQPLKSGRGFALLSREQQRALASLGGKRAQALGTAHRFTPESARAAGLRGGKVAHLLGRAHRFTPEEARAAALKGIELAKQRATEKAQLQEQAASTPDSVPPARVGLQSLGDATSEAAK